MELIQFVYKGLNGGEASGVKEIEAAFKEYEKDGNYSEEDRLFISEVLLFSTTYQLYNIQQGAERLAKEGNDSENTRVELENAFKFFKEKYGIVHQ